MAVSGPLRTAHRAKTEAEQRTELATQPDEIRARHILVMHAKSKAKPEGVARTREQALQRAKECLEKLRGGEEIEKLVGEYSDEPGAAECNGDLGTFRREVMIQAFSDAAFKLKPGEISEVVETPYGFHIIQRTK
jgi:parvulin-like peptidyl-prolyl isomerase